MIVRILTPQATTKMADTAPIYGEDEKGHPQFLLGSKTHKIDSRITNMACIVCRTAFGYRTVLCATDYTAFNWTYFAENDDQIHAVVEAFRAYRGL